MLTKRNSQTSLEFMILVGILFFLVLLISLYQLHDAKQVYQQKESDLVYDLALKLQEEIRTASLVEDGYARNFNVPARLENFDYNITAKGGFLTVKSNNSIYTIRIPNMTGYVNKGENAIRKSGGVLYINQ